MIAFYHPGIKNARVNCEHLTSKSREMSQNTYEEELVGYIRKTVDVTSELSR